MSTSLSMLRFGHAWTFLGLLHVVITAVSSYVQLPCYIWRTLSPCIHSRLLTLAVFLSPFLHWALSLGRGASSSDVPFRAKHSAVSYSLLSVHLMIYVDHHLLQREAPLPWGLNDVFISEYKNKPLEVSLTLHPLSTTVAVDSPLGPMASLVMDS